MTGAAGPACRLHVKIALATGVPFAVLWGGWMALNQPMGPEPALTGVLAVAALLAGLLFGVLMSAVVGTMQWRSGRDRMARRGGDPDGPGAVDLGVRHTRTVRVGLPAAEVRRRSVAVARILRRARVADTGQGPGPIALWVGTSRRSWGERVELRVDPHDASTTDVTVSSRPIWPWTLADYGKNADNVDRVVGWLDGLADWGTPP